MCNVLYREGRAWALDSIRQLQNSAGKGDQFRQLINHLERGTKNKPADFIRGVESIIDQVKKVAA